MKIESDRNFDVANYKENIVVSKLVAEYNLESMKVFPYTHCKVRVWQKSGEYVAYSNIGIIDKMNGNTEDRVCGFGSTIELALDDLINRTIELICYYENEWGRKLNDEDYCYSDPDDF